MRLCSTAAPAAAAIDNDALPEWDLSDLYAAPDAPEVQADLGAALEAARALEAQHKGKVGALDGPALAGLLRAYEGLSDRLGRVASYAQLLHAANAEDPIIGRFYQGVKERVNEAGTALLFVTLEINRIADDALAERLAASEELAHYKPWLDEVRAYRPHQLSDEAERLLHEKAITGRGAWVRLFDETMAGLRFDLDGKRLTATEIFDRLTAKERAERDAAARAIGKTLAANGRLFALITNTLAKDKQLEDGWRNFARPISARNLANRVEDDVVDALIAAVRDSYPRLSHRYYAIKAKMLGLDHLEHFDRNAPLPDDDDSRIAWDDARVVVLDAYRGFSPRLAGILEGFFERRWIDARPRPGKDAGAFCHPTVPSAHPYVLMNYQGKQRDVMTLAHELGHGVHQVLAAEQGPLMAGTPLTLAETASVFGEQLTFQSLLAQQDDPKRRRVLLCSKIEDALNTLVRQIAFCEFERRVHDRRREQELTADELGEIWLGVQTESLGPAFRFRDEYRVYWSYIPHFIHAPFYVYAYAFGDCLVNALYAVFRERPEGFEERYLAMLRAGGTLRHKELLAPFDLDASDPAFWAKGLGVVAGMIDQLAAEMGDA